MGMRKRYLKTPIAQLVPKDVVLRFPFLSLRDEEKDQLSAYLHFLGEDSRRFNEGSVNVRKKRDLIRVLFYSTVPTARHV